jgi:alcohol dehydrogenase YqhD (iron-dependent ADH family)
MPSLLRYFINHGSAEQIARAARLAVAVFGVSPDFSDTKAVALEGLLRFRSWIKSLGMPLTLTELGIPKKDLATVIKRCVDSNGGIIHGYMELDKDAIAEIYTQALE